MKRFLLYPLTVLIFLAVAAGDAGAQWIEDGTVVSSEPSSQFDPVVISDGSGGFIVTWCDVRNGNGDIYAQRVGATGAAMWAAGGVAVCTDPQWQEFPDLAADGTGGAIIAWRDDRGSVDVYAQRIDAAGTPQWTADGEVICNAGGIQEDVKVTGDGSGGAIITWTDLRSVDIDIFAQRITSAAGQLWTTNGTAVCSAFGNQDDPVLIGDGTGGAIVAWEDERGATFDIYAQHVTFLGGGAWTLDGVGITFAADSQNSPRIASDGAGGAIVAWQDNRASSTDIYARRINAAGTPLWTADGERICGASTNQLRPRIASDGSGGAIITWDDQRNAGDLDIYAAKITAGGVTPWTNDGVPVCVIATTQATPMIVSDGAGGGVIAWEDLRNGDTDVYAQRISAYGASLWTANGVPASTANGIQGDPTIAADGSGGIFVTWWDQRSGVNDVYAQRLEGRYGEWGMPEPSAVSAEDNPGDQGGSVVVRWDASQRDQFFDSLISRYSVWRSTDAPTASAGASVMVSSPNEIGADFSGKAIWEESTASGSTFWEWMDNVPAAYQSSYSYTAETRNDSTSSDPGEHWFKVLSHESTAPQTHVWESGVVTGYSVDNLAPSSPLMLAAVRVGSDVELQWNGNAEVDLRDYALYRAGAPGVTPSEALFLTSSIDTMQTDESVPAGALYYIVTAFDIHENESPPSNEASVGPATGVGETPVAPRSLTVLPNHPNPFAARTTVTVGIPELADVTIDIFDVAGRRARSRALGAVAAGWKKVVLDARDDSGVRLPSGVYFYRVHAGNASITRKMVITR